MVRRPPPGPRAGGCRGLAGAARKLLRRGGLPTGADVAAGN